MNTAMIILLIIITIMLGFIIFLQMKLMKTSDNAVLLDKVESENKSVCEIVLNQQNRII